MKVLVVEDSKRLGSFLKRALEEEGYVADIAVDGTTALAQAENIPYDVIVLDWMLPDIDGVRVCRELRARGVPIPIIMLTARGEVAERITGLDAGADDYIVKPFDLGEFLARVRARARREIGGNAMVIGPLMIDRAERRAVLAGEVLSLTPREFSLLAHLARNAGRVVPRTELLSKVWETMFDPGSNVIEAHVKNLREKLGSHATMIETVRGTGYRLVVP
ncbi:MAG TPA: response regulator transcription factor [Polyangiaceae bacterium]|jgi:two-component system OmpR family response regulator|nr:response regulator transcription factor [Polyangiaceae bacterium]